MSVNVQNIRGNSSTSPSAGSYIGPIAQILVDTDRWAIRLQDGVTAGGHIIGSVGGSSFTLDPVSTGTTHSVTLSTAQTITYWSSSTSGAKTTDIPGAAAGNSGYELIVKTTLGNGDTHTITPSSGTIDGASSLSFVDNKTAVTLISDGSSNWMIV